MPSPAIVLPTVTIAPTEALTIVVPPSGLAQDERMAALAGLISTLSHPFPDQRSTVEITYNLLQIGIPEIRSVTSSFTTLVVKNVAPTREEFLTWAGVLGGSEAKLNTNLPRLPGDVKSEAIGVTKEGAVYIALASLLFCMGKQATESAKASVLDNRPDALIRRFALSEGDQLLLPGRAAGPCREAMEGIYNSFANYTEVRKAIILLFLGLRHSAQHLPIHLEIMMTNFSLMRGSGMTHVEAVTKLIQMHPWVMSVPELEPFFYRFARDLEAFQEVDPAVRPYHRLLVPQSEYLFVSSEIRPLIAVAGAFIEEVEKTFSGYVYNKEVYTDLIEKVKSYVPGYNPTSSMTRLADLLGVKTAPLPARKAPVTTPQSSVV